MRVQLLIAAAWLLAAPVHAVEVIVDGGFDDPAHGAWEFQKYDTDSVIERSATDSGGDPGSGSLSLAKILAQTPNSLRAAQCVEVIGGAEYALSGKVFVPSASLDLDGVSILDVDWNTTAACNGFSAGVHQSHLTGLPRDVWSEVGPIALTAPLDALGARLYVGVVVYQPPREGAPEFFAASWDDVSLVPEPGAGTGAALVAAAALARARRR